MPSFVYESLLWWGLPLVGVPVLIHLINLMRHRRVKWAAMEFLLQSQKRHRKSVLLKQLLLLLLRMLAIAAVVLMVAQPLLRNQWGAIFGGSRTHHIVLVDDSFSMSDRWADTSAFEGAKQVVSRLAAGAERQATPQLFTLLRFSRCQPLPDGAQPDLLEQPLDADFAARLEKTLGQLRTSETDVGPDAALAAVDRLPGKPEDEDRVVYLVTDFRTGQWQEPDALREALSRLDEDGTQLHLINCASAVHENVAVASLHPAGGTRAAGVPLLVELSLRNFGTTDARGVSVTLTEDGQPRPPIVFEEVPAGKTVTRRFPVLFTTAGQHEIVARCQSDAVDADNKRALVVDVPEVVDILLIDGDADANDGFFLATALAPGGKVASGLRPIVESPSYLRDHPLDGFDTIYLLNVPRLGAAEIAALEAFVQAGGGLGIFLGERCRAEFYNNSLYRDGEGLFPLPLSAPRELLVDRLEKTPDVEVTDHPIFTVFAGERNSFLGAVVINRYFAAANNWLPEPDSGTRIIAKLRNKAPLVVEHAFGDGRVVVFLTKASPLETALGSWNNWGRDNPSFVVAMHELQSHLAAKRHADTSRLVGTPLAVPVDVSRYLPQVQFVVPHDLGDASLAVDAAATDEGHTATLRQTDASGIYRAQLTATDGSELVEHFAVNVVPDEGNLRKLSSSQLAGRLEGVRYEYHEADDINYNPQQLAGFNLAQSLLFVLIGILLCEQVLAYACSYHPRSTEARA